MRILHIWNTAGIASILAKEQRKKGHDVSVLMRASHDAFGFTKYYGDILIDSVANEFIELCIKKARDMDIIHIHSAMSLVTRMRDEYPHKSIVIHYHGTDLTQKSFDSNLEVIKRATCTLVSTPDLKRILEEKGIDCTWIPNPVDTDLFRNMNLRRKNKALIMNMGNLLINSALDYGWEYGLVRYHIHNRDTESIPYKDMPSLLNQFTSYADIKCPPDLDGVPVDAFSTAGLQALACGCEVFHMGDLYQGLPREHHPEYSYNLLNDIYKSIT